MLSRTVHFFGADFDLPGTFFCFCSTCLFVTFRTSFDVADRNIILLYSGMASKFFRSGDPMIIPRNIISKPASVGGKFP